MSGDGTKSPPPYLVPEGQNDGVKVYHVHTPFTPPPQQEVTVSQDRPVFTSGGGGVGSERLPGESKKKFVSYDVGLGRNPGMTNCDSCRQNVMTDVTYKAGTYAWLMCLLFICCGLFLCCCLIPFFLDSFKDAYHTCPNCKKVLHIEKKKCCE
ncbi:lITAF domain-containing protein isoform X2 [Nothobranchius furzeri]|uniref:Transcript variant X2 n=2 Tax=Nothobranchius TaxID=28779 RepID=A0A9D2YHR2_NOTFU|nr:lipopolysaccharide-induced tumor necrosis factor-alpha factor homolog-like isoform X2 [Nothobranchius furzeri]KAF7220835.1 transcript variant X2 [Nothobranchius furzeri]